MAGFFKGLGRRESFAQLTTSFYFVYEAMERALDTLDCPTLKALDFPELRRLPGLERDMAFYYGADWRSKIKPSPATRKYVAQINKVAASDEPELLVGHLYSRYLGDLFGGRTMSGMALPTPGRPATVAAAPWPSRSSTRFRFGAFITKMVHGAQRARPRRGGTRAADRRGGERRLPAQHLCLQNAARGQRGRERAMAAGAVDARDVVGAPVAAEAWRVVDAHTLVG